MFERTKIGGAIDYFLRSSGATKGLGRTKVEVWLNGHSRPYATIMRAQRLSSDQAAVLLITKVISGMSADDILNLRVIDPEIVAQLKALFLVCDALLKSKPDTFSAQFTMPSEATFYALVMS